MADHPNLLSNPHPAAVEAFYIAQFGKKSHLIFLDVEQGAASKLGKSTSKYNEVNLTTFMFYLKRLIEAGFPTSGIGVLTPYTYQLT